MAVIADINDSGLPASLQLRLPTLVLTTTQPPPPATSTQDEDCPVCYEPFPPTGGAPTSVACKVCKHAVCGECDVVLTQTGHVRCPMCRAPRPRRPLRLHMAIHAFHCADQACTRPQCADAKLILLKVQTHAQKRNCGASPSGECKACKLWRVLNNTATPPAAEFASASALPPIPQEIPEEASEALRLRLRELPPAQVKRMLISHVRQCRNQQCIACRKLQRVAQRIRSRQAAAL